MRNNEYYESLISYNNYLAHHGVKGQKWGVRRYQNPDGSLTAKGKRHQVVAEGYKSLAEQNAAAKNNSKGVARAIYAVNEKTYAKKAAKEQSKLNKHIDAEAKATAEKKAAEHEAIENERRKDFERSSEQASMLADAHINNARNASDFRAKTLSETYEYMKKNDINADHDGDLSMALLAGEANALIKSMRDNPDVVKAYQKEYDSMSSFVRSPNNKPFYSYKNPNGKPGATIEIDSEYGRGISKDDYVTDSIFEKAIDSTFDRGGPNKETIEAYRAYHKNRRSNNP